MRRRPSILSSIARSVMLGFASLFTFGETDRHFAEPPAVLQPAAEERSDRGDDADL